MGARLAAPNIVSPMNVAIRRTYDIHNKGTSWTGSRLHMDRDPKYDPEKGVCRVHVCSRRERVVVDYNPM